MSKKSVETLPIQFLATTFQNSGSLLESFQKREGQMRYLIIPDNPKILVNNAKLYFLVKLHMY
jgi:hypothetical protein